MLIIKLMNHSFLLGLWLVFSAGAVQAAPISVNPATVIGGVVVENQFVVGTAGNTQPLNNWPVAEFPGAAVDGLLATKYLNFAKLNTGLIVEVLPESANIALNTLTFVTANDASARDPLTFSLYGSSTVLSGAGPFDLSSLTSIVLNASTGLEPFDFTYEDGGRWKASAPRTFSNTMAYASYLIIFPTVRDPAESNSMQIGEISFEGTAVPEPNALLLGALGAGGWAAVAGRRLLLRPRLRKEHH